MNLDAELTEVFRASCLEQLADIEARVLGLESLAKAEGRAGDGGEYIGAIFRAAHSLKADAHAMGLSRMSRLAHQTENLLSLVRDDRLTITHGLVDALLAVFDRLRAMAEDPPRAEELDISEGLAKLCGILVQTLAEGPACPVAAPGQHPGTTPAASASEYSSAPAAPLAAPSAAALASSISGSAKMSTAPTASAGSALAGSASAGSASADKTAADTDAPACAPADVSVEFDAVRISTLSVPATRLDSLVDQVGELAVSQASLSGLAHDLGNHRLAAVAEDVERLTTGLRGQVMALRMLPLKVIFAKFRRLVREVAKDTGKQVSLTVLGEGVELDKAAIEQLQAPLSHLLRNAVDHGIEAPADRVRAGKPAEGRVWLEARHLGGEVEIVVADDGPGMDPEALHQEAVARGVVEADAPLSRQAMLNLAFAPGLSTRQSVSDFSGRGVGMDAVRADIQRMRGRVDLDCAPGQGTRVTIRVPLSLAILDCLHVRAGEGMYFFQLSSVEECFEIRRSQAGLIGGFGIATLRGAMLPVVCLREYFSAGQTDEQIGDQGGDPQNPTHSPLSDLAPVVVVQAGEDRFGLVVDHIVGHRQTVLKKISSVLGEMSAIQGGAVLEDGGMGLVLDLAALSRDALAEHHARQTARQQGREPLPPSETETP